MYDNELTHHGVKGQKWGVRRYQNPDGSLTEKGRKRLAKLETQEQKRSETENKSYKKLRASIEKHPNLSALNPSVWKNAIVNEYVNSRDDIRYNRDAFQNAATKGHKIVSQKEYMKMSDIDRDKYDGLRYGGKAYVERSKTVVTNPGMLVKSIRASVKDSK